MQLQCLLLLLFELQWQLLLCKHGAGKEPLLCPVIRATARHLCAKRLM